MKVGGIWWERGGRQGERGRKERSDIACIEVPSSFEKEHLFTFTSCVSLKRSRQKVSKASIDFSTRFPPIHHT